MSSHHPSGTSRCLALPGDLFPCNLGFSLNAACVGGVFFVGSRETGVARLAPPRPEAASSR